MEEIIVRRVIPSDNSCLFNAVGYVMERDKNKAPELRQVIAATVASDPAKYSEAFLGKPNQEYCSWIQDSDKWGGVPNFCCPLLGQTLTYAGQLREYGSKLCQHDINESSYNSWLPLCSSRSRSIYEQYETLPTAIAVGQEEQLRQSAELHAAHIFCAIELSILAGYYGRQIAAYDIQTTRCDLYGQEKQFSERVMLIYDGLHYDALAMSPFDGAPEEFDQTIFTVQKDRTIGPAEALALKLVKEQQRKRSYTDTANFTLRCGVCQIGVVGQKEAAEHAQATGHVNFQEYR